jgi:anti-sigma regulatory factor (Ser/Thr protein kinase)
MRFPMRADSVSEARHFVRLVFSICPSQIVEAAELLTSELATNVVLHARTAFDVIASQSDETLRVAVHDESNRMPVPLAREPCDLHGRGLSMVELLADHWGTIKDRPGKTVWFDLRIR